jgi:cytosine/adenosine deaminase-related metal-dependent hydrolase
VDIGELPRTDIHVRDGEIVHIGRALPASVMLEIDGNGLIAMPGVVADHCHAVIDTIERAGCERGVAMGATAEDIYRIARLAMLELVSSGFTSLHHCALGIQADHAETVVLAQIDSGLRGCFSYPLSAQDKEREALTELSERWSAGHSDGRLEIRPPSDDGGFICHAGEPARSGLRPEPQQPDLADCARGAVRRLAPDSRIGSLSPGNRADLILVDPGISVRGLSKEARPLASARDINAANVVMVCIDGRIRKRNGVVVEPGESLIRREGQEALARLRNPATQPFSRSSYSW